VVARRRLLGVHGSSSSTTGAWGGCSCVLLLLHLACLVAVGCGCVEVSP
jgi:hypothetical protein